MKSLHSTVSDSCNDSLCFILIEISHEEYSCRIAKKAYESAFANMESLDEDNYRQACIVMQALRDRLNFYDTKLH